MPFLISSSRFFARGLARHHFLPFAEAREYARSLGFTRWRQWVDFCKSGERPATIPAAPSKIYRDSGWCNGSDWLGYNYIPRPVVLSESGLRRHQIFARTVKERQKITQYIQQLDPRIEFRHLRLGLLVQANTLFRIRDMNEAGDTNTNFDAKSPTNDNEGTHQKMYLPIQMKSGVLLNNRKRCLYGVKNITPIRDVAVLIISRDSESLSASDSDTNHFLSLAYDRPQNLRSKSYRMEQCSPLSNLPALLHQWWQIATPASELEWRNRICGNNPDSYQLLIERINALVQTSFFEPCGLSSQHIPDVDDAANILLDGRFRIRSIIAAKKKSATRGTYIHRSRSFRPGYQNALLSQDDDIDFYLIFIQTDGVLNGLYLMPQSIFLEKMVGSFVGERNNLGTCMLYPPCENPKSKKGKIMQVWQNEYYVSNLQEFREMAEKFGIISRDKLVLKSTSPIEV